MNARASLAVLCGQLERTSFLDLITWVPGHGMASAAGAAFVLTVDRPHH